MLKPARSTMRHRSGKDYREHSPRHQPPAVRVRRHWRTALQGRIYRVIPFFLYKKVPYTLSPIEISFGM